MGFLSLATAFIFEEAHRQWKRGIPVASVALCIVAIPLFWQETKSHIAYTAGFRGINIETADLAKARYTNATNNVDERQALLNKHTKDLEALEAANAWATTTTATALRAQLDSAQKAIDLETARGGCKAKCLGLMQQKADLEGRIAKAEERTNLTNQIAALKTELSQVREKADKVEHKPSIVQHQNTTLVKISAMLTSGNLEASPFLKEVVEQENTIGLALMPVILPALFFSLMGLYRKEGEDETPAPVLKALMPKPLLAQAPGSTIIVTEKSAPPSDDIWKVLHSKLNGAANAA
jgi:hypothetical protein